MRIKTVSLLIVVMFLAVKVSSQQGSENVDESLVTPEAVRITLLHRKLEAGEDPSVKGTFKKRDKIYFRLKMTNISLARVAVSVIDPYYENRPQLFRGGELVPYREQISELIKYKEKEPSDRHRGLVRLEPNQTKEWIYIDLAAWYDQLEPGHYQLSLKHRVEYSQQWLESNALTFDVTDK